ncbi:MAG: Gfo/Idh/MocA family oxidoreductase [Candidatus Thorarchaeota archaeon]|nr:MAG: Gfo/Idh/MocA family oxidoreductase [Candidatus Thorarchaeota archaeon]
MPEMVNFGIVGCGRISDLHAPGYLANPKAQILAICDVDLDRAKTKAKEWKVSEGMVFAEFDQLLRLDELDAVELLVPHHLHAEMTIRAARAGKHISVQKPMANSLSECQQMIAAAENHDVKLRVFENFRFYPPYLKAKELLDGGAVGRPSSIHIKLGVSHAGGWDVPMDAWMWRIDPDTCGGGPLCWDDGYHKFSIAEFFLGDIEKVKAWIDSTGMFDDEDEAPFVVDAPAVFMWKYKTPRTYGSMEATWSRHGNFPSKYYSADERVEITGDKGYIWVNQCTANSLRNEAPVVTFIEGELVEYHNLESDWFSSFTGAVDHFVEALFMDSEPVLTGEQGMKIQRFAHAAHKSAQIGTEILLDELHD